MCNKNLLLKKILLFLFTKFFLVLCYNIFCCCPIISDPPQVTLSLGSTLNPDDIKEGDDVYFECHIKANPKEHRITWSHDVSLLLYTTSIGKLCVDCFAVVVKRTKFKRFYRKANNPLQFLPMFKKYLYNL